MSIYRILNVNRFLNVNRWSKAALSAVACCSLAGSILAQTPASHEMVPERGFTIPSSGQTPFVIQTAPNAVCGLHAANAGDSAPVMKLLANEDGYIRVHVSSKVDSENDAHVQIDCTAGGKLTIYPIHLRSGVAATDAMPAPQTTVPLPKGSRVLPALTEAEAAQLSDQELLGRGYPQRPDASAEPQLYKSWVRAFSKQVTLLAPPTSTSGDQGLGVQYGTEYSLAWCGYEAQGANGTYSSVHGAWYVPDIPIGEPGYQTNSGLWVGLDGDDGATDLVQAGTAQNYLDLDGLNFANYTAWTEVVPNQPVGQPLPLNISAGDQMFVDVWVSDGQAYFLVADDATNETVVSQTALGKTKFLGKTAEWIMERPTVAGKFGELSMFIIAVMNNAYANSTPVSTAANVQLTMVNSSKTDLATASLLPPDGIFFDWKNFH